MLSSQTLKSYVPPTVFSDVCVLFKDSQYHSSVHRKNIHSLKKLHGQCAGQPRGEEHFFLAFLHCLHVLLAMKKGEEALPKLMRFAVGYLMVLGESRREESAVFLENLLQYLLDKVDCKDKTVRVRLCQLTVACINSLDELSDQLWSLFRAKMVERLFDKEPAVRAQAVHACARLQSLEADNGLKIGDLFLDLLEHDPSAEVRRAVLTQVDVTAQTLPFVLNRRRDLDASVRRYFFATKLQEIDVSCLTIEQRDLVLQSGLQDRDAAVQKACIDVLFGTWLSRANSNLVELVSCLDALADPDTGERVLATFFDIYRTPLFDVLPAGYVDNLTVETGFILKMYCRHIGQEKADALLPEMNDLTHVLLQTYQTSLCFSADQAQAISEVEFIMLQVVQLLRMKDGGDEAGRRTALPLLEEMLCNVELGEALFCECLQLFLQCSRSNDAFIERAVQIMLDFKDFYEKHRAEGKEDMGMTEEKRVLAQLRCLLLVGEVVKTQSSVAAGSYLWAILGELVIPAVNSSLALVQEAGLKALMLYCLLSKELTAEYAALLLDFVRLSHGSVRLEAIRGLFDLLLIRSVDSDYGERTRKALTTCLYDGDVTVQGVCAEGFAKLLLHDQVPADDALAVLEGLMTLYLLDSAEPPSHLLADDPFSGKNDQQLWAWHRRTQCLAYFIQAYAFSTKERQASLRAVLVPVFVHVLHSASAKGDDPLTIFGRLLYLADPQNNILLHQTTKTFDGEEGHDVEDQAESDAWLKVALELAWALVHPSNRDYGRVLSQALSKLPLGKPNRAQGHRNLQSLLLILGHAAKVFGATGPLSRTLATCTALVDEDGHSGEEAAGKLTEEALQAIKRQLHAQCPLLATPAPPSQSAGTRTIKKKAASKKGTPLLPDDDDYDDDLDDDDC